MVKEFLPSCERLRFDFPSQTKKKKKKYLGRQHGMGLGTQHLQPERSGLDPISACKDNVTWRSYLTSLESQDGADSNFQGVLRIT